jgi:hypothetical protein
MRRYERAWCCLWLPLAALGVALGVLETSAIDVLLILGLLLTFGGLVRSLLPPGVSSPRPLTLAIGMLTVIAFALVSFPLGLLVLLTGCLSSPAVVRRCLHAGRHRAARQAVAPPRHTEPKGTEDADCSLTLSESMGPLHGLDDRQLCRLWRESFWVLRDAAPPGTVLRVVSLRGACLEELERREPAAVQAWLESGARASGGPEKYLGQHLPVTKPGRRPDADQAS